MARVSLVEERDHPELAEQIHKVKSGRGRLINVYKLLLHSPDVAMAWLDFIGSVRWKTGLDGATRELAIVRVAILNGVDYVVKDHVPSQAVREGLTLEQCAALRDWEASELFDSQQRAVLYYVDAMTRDVAVPDGVFASLQNYFNEHQIVDLSVLIGAYNMQTRVLRALEIDPEGT